MSVEKSAGALVFRKRKDRKEYLLLHYPQGSKSKKDYWDFPKGHIEEGETRLDAAKREVKEETGIKDLRILEGFKKGIRYFFRIKDKPILKKVVFYLAETKTRKIRLSNEHIGFAWLSFAKAVKKLTFDNAKEILKEADDFFSKRSLPSRQKNTERQGDDLQRGG